MARLAVDQWLHERRPAPDLVDRLVCAWRGDLGDAATPLPDERLDLVWVDDGSLWLSGPETTSWSRGYPPGTTAIGLSERQLHRRCMAAFGYGPAVLARILRLQRALQLARSRQGPLRLAELAAAAGYFDQQHLAHEVRAIMGTTPTALLLSC